MGDAKYHPPLIVSIDGEGNNPRMRTRRIGLGERTRGKFVVCADADDVRLYGLLYAEASSRGDVLNLIDHGEILQFLERVGETPDVIGLWLGGGMLSIDHDLRALHASGSSMRIGACPRGLVERCLQNSRYSPRLALNEVSVLPPSGSHAEREWYQTHGFQVR